VWFVPPAALSSTAIVLGFLATPRFPRTPAFLGVLVWIVCGTAIALAVGIRKSRRETKRYEHLIDEISS
jgi:MFS superfamily sulfate permease-like transporter